MTDLKTMLHEGEEDIPKLSVRCNRRAGYLACIHDITEYIISGDNVSKELRHELIPFFIERYSDAAIATAEDSEHLKELEDNMVGILKQD